MPDAIDQWITVSEMWSVRVVKFNENVYDANHIEAIRMHLIMVLDMSNVTHTSSIFLGMILQLSLKLSRLGGALRIACMSRDVRDMFDLMRVGDVVQVHEGVNQAVKSF